MTNVIETDKKTIYAVGDIHGNFKAIGNWIKTYDLHNCALVFCGDFGLGFKPINVEYDFLYKSQLICDKYDVECYIVRGNHDDPTYYNIYPKKLNLSRFKPLSDYSVIKSPQHNILCLGGAVSTDRAYRIALYESHIETIMSNKKLPYNEAKNLVKQCWWSDEGFVYNETILEKIISSGINIDTVCSHSAPECCFPRGNGNMASLFLKDCNLENDIKNERHDLSLALAFLRDNGIKPKNWFYGHYHNKNTEMIDGTTFHLLDMARNGKTSLMIGGYFDMKEIL